MFHTPQEVYEKIRVKNDTSFYNARMLAGYVWAWTSENRENGEVSDVKKTEYNFIMPWGINLNKLRVYSLKMQ
ncbi:DNA/RNA helicase domain-containing protein [Peribacillus frigoritolerans]